MEIVDQQNAPSDIASGSDRLPTRRSFLIRFITSPVTFAWTVFTVTLGTWALASFRFMFPNVLVEPPMRFAIGLTSDYPPESVSTQWVAQHGILIVRTTGYDGTDKIVALSTTCTHLGCIVNWLSNERKFKCPCHGSGFYMTGINYEGPAPRPLERHGIRLTSGGTLEVDKSMTFRQELGQWDDPASFVDGAMV